MPCCSLVKPKVSVASFIRSKSPSGRGFHLDVFRTHLRPQALCSTVGILMLGSELHKGDSDVGVGSVRCRKTFNEDDVQPCRASRAILLIRHEFCAAFVIPVTPPCRNMRTRAVLLHVIVILVWLRVTASVLGRRRRNQNEPASILTCFQPPKLWFIGGYAKRVRGGIQEMRPRNIAVATAR